MSLKIWLPLNGDLRNNGLDDFSITTYGTTSFVNSKLGKGLNCNGYSYWIIDNINVGSNMSITFWAKATSTGMAWVLGSNDSALLNFWTYNNTYYLNSGDSYQNPFKDNSNTNVVNFIDGTWHHFAVIFNSIETKLYIDGEYVGKAVTFKNPTTTNGILKIGGGYRDAHSQDWHGVLNDFRLYDCALSIKEIKEISKGLIIHYPLDRGGLGASNLIKNGFGEFGNENWSSSTNISTTDIPSGQSNIKASFANGTTLEHINIYPTHTYKFSAWIKATATSGNVYPSLYPYDVDKKYIAYYNCPDGFNQNTMTTLTQQLKSGDTQIYVNDLSNWNANSGHYYNWVAIFSYTDSTGYTYPDGQYTQNCVRFGSGTNAKTNLDKTNNIITLTTAYTGRTMPVGTKVCASTEGATNYYPLGGFNLTNIQDWTYKENSFSGGINRLKYAKTVIFWTYSNNRMAGIKFEDVTANELTDATEYDTSGFENNGTLVGNFEYSFDTSRYDVCTKFNGTDNCIQIGNWYNVFQNPFTINLWWKKEVLGSKNYETLVGGGSGFEMDTRSNSAQMLSLYMTSTRGGNVYSPFNFNQWYMVTMVNDGTNELYYVDGELVKTIEKKSMPNTDYFIGSWQTATKQNYCGLMSDFRIYATALSADQVLELYKTPASIDKNNNFYAYSYKELNQGNEIEYLYDLTKSGNGTFSQDENGLYLDQDIWVTHNYTPINSTNKTYKYDIIYSCDAGNHFYIGWERYDADKTARSNNACVYVVGTKPSEDRIKYRVRGIVDLSNDGVNPCAFIKLRILNKWTGSDSDTNGTAIIHYLSLKKYTDTTTQDMTPLNINKQGIVNTTEILEKDIGVSVSNVYELNSHNFYEY